MPKAYWVTQYTQVRDPEKLTRYAALAGPAIEEAGGRFLARGNAEYAFEGGKIERTVLIEFSSIEAAHAAHESPGYQEALVALDGGASRDFRIVEGVE
jgi:uncharacterized protein (DUF1330 family)